MLAMPAAAKMPEGAFDLSKPPTVKPITPPRQDNAIPLYDGPAPDNEDAGQTEGWLSLGGTMIVHNVTEPTLTPYLPDNPTGAAVLVAPGGGFTMLSMENEGYRVAKWLADRGIAAFVLKYRVRPTPDNDEMARQLAKEFSSPPQPERVAGERPSAYGPAVDDAQQALRLIHSGAKEWHVDPDRVGMVGFSAGAMTTLATALRNAADAKPAFIGVIYGPLQAVEVPEGAPPMFNAIAANDPIFRSGSFDIIQSWITAGVPVEFHLYQSGSHGFGMMETSTTADLWKDEFYTWIKDNGFLEAQ